MLNPKELYNDAKQALKNEMQGKVENAIIQTASYGDMKLTFSWDREPRQAEFVEEYKDDKFIFPEGLEIKTDAHGITVSWENA